MRSVNDTIKEVYFGEGGFGSAKETLKDAREKNPAITLKDVQAWRERYLPRKTPLRGFNSYVAPGPLHNFQVDMFWYKFEQPEAPKLKDQKGRKDTYGVQQYGVLAVDSFTKYVHVVPLDRKSKTPWLDALKQIVAKMGKPKQIYSDPDSSLNSRDVQAYFKSYGIEHIQTREHAPIAERTIRTIKSLIDKRMEDRPKIWTEYLPEVLKKYNEKMVHSATGLTPADAKKGENELYAKTNLEVKRISNRKYPELAVGNFVRVYKKKTQFAKERVPVWEDEVKRITGVRTSHGQTLYSVNGSRTLYIRSNLLKVNGP
jgi:transposase InsO family protein